MAAPLSPTKSFVEFCYRVADTDPVETMEAACEEIAWHRRENRTATSRLDFRHGSKGKMYCDQLQHLVYLLMNGEVPERAPKSFHHDVAPLVRRLIKRWEIGTLRRTFSD